MLEYASGSDDSPRHASHRLVWGDSLIPAIRKEARPAPTDSAALRNEIRVLGLLHGIQGVPRLLQADDQGAWLVQARPAGAPLGAGAARLGQLPASSLRCLIALLDILEQVHARGVLHAHITPSSLLFDPDTDSLHLSDFAHAAAQRHVDADLQSAAAQEVLLPFSAPEQTGRMARTVDYRADFYALGAIGYWLLAGTPPFAETEPLALLHALLTRTPAPLDTLRQDLPSGLSVIIARLLAKHPEERYQSAHGLRRDLQRCLAGDADAEALGRDDHRTQPTRPSRLFDREEALADLQALLEMSDAQGSRMALVRGYAGAGKSALVQALLPFISTRNGLLANGKYTQFQRLAPFSGLAEAMAEIAEYWRAERPDRLADIRARLLQRLQDNAALLARTVPGFGALLWPQGAPPAEAEPGSPMRPRMLKVMAALCDTLADANVPCVLFIDDLQWADADSLALLESLGLDHSRGTLLLVGAYRDHEVDAAHPLTALLAQLRKSGAELLELEMGGLDAPTVAALLADVLDSTQDDLGTLATQLHRKTEGNAFFVLEYVRRLFDAAHLRRVQALWQWDTQAVAALPDSDNLVAGLIAELHHMPAEVQDIAGGCACAGGAIDTELLAAACGTSASQVEQWLLPLLQRGLLTASSSGASVRLRFGHDRMQEAALGLLAPPARARWHLGLARVLQQRRDTAGTLTDASEDGHTAAAGHYLQALDDVVDAGEQGAVLRLLVAAASRAMAQGAASHALRLLQGARALQARLPPDAGREREISLLEHASLFALLRYEEMDPLFEALRPAVEADPLAQHQAAVRQARSLMLRGKGPDSIALALHFAGLLGLPCPGPDEWATAMGAEMDWLSQMEQAHGEALFDGIAPLQDPRLLAAAMLLVNAQFTPLVDKHQTGSWCNLRLIRLGREQGTFPWLPHALTGAFTPLATFRNSPALGCRVGRIGLRLAPAIASDEATARMLYRWGCAVSIWSEPLETRFPYFERIAQLAHKMGETLTPTDTLLWELAFTFESAPRLEQMDGVLAKAFALSRRARSSIAMGSSSVFDLLTRFAKGQMTTLDEAHADRDLIRHINSSLNPRVHFLICCALAAAIGGRWSAVLEHTRQAMALTMLPNVYMYALRQWLHALALYRTAQGKDAAVREAALAEAAPLLQWLDERAVDAPTNFGHMALLLQAMRAWAGDDFRGAARLFEAAIDAAAPHRPWHHGVACEITADFYRAQQLGMAADLHLARAVQAFEAWGAPAQVARLRALGRRPDAVVLLPVFNPPAAELPAQQRMDLQAVSSAGQALMSEREPASLLRVLLNLVRQYAGAEYGVVCWREDGQWRQHAEFDNEAQRVAAGEQPSSAFTVQVPDAVLHYLAQGDTHLLLHDLRRHARFSRDAALRGRGAKSIAALPILLRGESVGLLYLENRHTATTLHEGHLETLRLICAQFATAYETARLYSHLEATVAARTQELHRSQATLRGVMENSPSPIFVKDRQGIYLMHNPRYSEAIGYAGQSLVGRRMSEFLAVAPDAAQAASRTDLQVFAGEVVAPYLMEIPAPSGLRTYLISKFPLHDASGAVTALCGIASDVTALKSTEAALRHAKDAADAANAAKSAFLANMSHELRTPMNAVIGLSHLALKTDLSARQRDYVHKIQQSGQHLLGILNDILDFSKVEAGKLAIESEPFELGQLLESVINLIAGKTLDKNLELISDLPADLPQSLRGDALRLKQVLINYANNAVKFTEQGEVVISVRVQEQSSDGLLLRFEVRDSGIGLSEEQMARLFRSFEQADASTTRQYGGTGLGLAISKRLAELMGGEVGVHSQLGQGSTFWFTARVGVRAQQAPPLRPAIDLHGRRVLVVDDNEHAAAVLAEMLQATGFVVHTVPSGAAALQALQQAADAQRPFEVVTLDWKMPQMDGLQTAIRIRDLGLDLPPRPIMVSAYGGEDLVRDAAQAGIDVLLPKPVTASMLVDALMRAFGLPGSPRNATPAVHGESQLLALAPLRGARILLVEDNALNRQVATELLQLAGFTVEVADNGERGVAMVVQAHAAAMPYDAVLMDMQMPVMDGVTASRYIRQNPAHAALPILAMTANAMQADRDLCTAAGMNDFIVKPIEPDALWSALQRWIRPRIGLPANAGADGAPPPTPPAARTPADAESTLQQLQAGVPGLNARLGLRRMAGRLPVYLEMLRKFASTQGQVSQEIDAALQAQDAALAQRLAHTLRGLAGNVGCTSLQHAAASVEDALRSHAPAHVLTSARADLAESLASILHALQTTLPALDVVQDAAAPPPSTATLPEVCTRLQTLIDNSDAEGQSHFDRHRALLDAAWGAACLPIAEALAEYDFDAAATALASAMASPVVRQATESQPG